MLGVFGIGGKNFPPEPFCLLDAWMIVQVILILALLGLVWPNLRILRGPDNIRAAGVFRFVRLARCIGTVSLLAGASFSVGSLMVVAHLISSQGGTPDSVFVTEAIYSKLKPLLWGLLAAVLAYIEAGIFEFLIERKLSRG